MNATSYVSGFCAVSRHERCRGDFGTARCTCDCHTTPPPFPLLERGQRVTVTPGTRWANEDLSGAELEVVDVHDFPADVGGPVFVCRWPGTTTAAGPHLQADQLETAGLAGEE